MKKISAKVLWIIVAVMFLIAIGIIIAIPNVVKPYNNILTVILIIIFLLLTLLIQFATYKSFNGRRKIKYKTIEFKTDNEDFESTLLKNEYKKEIRKYGTSFLKIKDKKAYKVTLVDDCDKYFDFDENDNNQKPNKELDKCKTFMGIEIFFNVTEEALKKIPDFTIQADKIYYTALVKTEDGNFRCLNYEKPSNTHNEQFDNIMHDLALERIE